MPVEELADRTKLLGARRGLEQRTLAEEFLAGHDLRPTTLTLGSNGSIKQAVRIGLGLSLQPRISVGLELASEILTMIDVEGGLPRRRWYVIRSSSGPIRPAVQKFFYFFCGEAHAVIETARPRAQRPVRCTPTGNRHP